MTTDTDTMPTVRRMHGYFGGRDLNDPTANQHFVLGRPGYAGSRGRKRRKRLDRLLGEDGWRSMHVWEGTLLDRAGATLLYEEAYYHHIARDPELQAWLERFAEVYDNDKSNLGSGCDYAVQEASSTHLQDIAIRRVMLRLGLRFKGYVGLLEVRGKRSLGYRLNPGKVPFHQPGAILQPAIDGWWEPGSIEDFWQSNKVLVATERGLVRFARRSSESKVFQVVYVDASTLPALEREAAAGHPVFHAVYGLGHLKSGRGKGDVATVVFAHSGSKCRFGEGEDESLDSLRDAAPLVPYSARFAAGEPLDWGDCWRLLQHVTPLSPTGKPTEGIWLSGDRVGRLGDSLRESLITAPSLEIRHRLVRDLLTKEWVNLEFGLKYGGQEIMAHLAEVLGDLDKALTLCASLAHHATLGWLGRLGSVEVQRAYYDGSYNPEGYEDVRLPVQQQAMDALVAVVREQMGIEALPCLSID